MRFDPGASTTRAGLTKCPPKCSLPLSVDGRQTPHEIYVKLCFVHSIVLAAYVNLLQPRNERWVVLCSTIVFLVPISPLGHFVIPPVANSVTAMTTSSGRTVFRQTLIIRYGRLLEHVAAGPFAEMPETQVERSVKAVVSSINLQLALITQCCTSV